MTWAGHYWLSHSCKLVIVFLRAGIRAVSRLRAKRKEITSAASFLITTSRPPRFADPPECGLAQDVVFNLADEPIE